MVLRRAASGGTACLLCVWRGASGARCVSGKVSTEAKRPGFRFVRLAGLSRAGATFNETGLSEEISTTNRTSSHAEPQA